MAEGFMDEDKVERCSLCGIVAVKFVPLNDNGTGGRVCRYCKKKVRNNEEIKKIKVEEDGKN